MEIVIEPSLPGALVARICQGYTCSGWFFCDSVFLCSKFDICAFY